MPGGMDQFPGFIPDPLLQAALSGQSQAVDQVFDGICLTLQGFADGMTLPATGCIFLEK